MKCIICDEILDIFTKESYLDLPVNYCKNCNLYINGDSKEEVNEKVSNMYKENYWNERNSETSINSEYTDVDSQGKRRNWVSQFSYTKPYINGNALLEKSALEILVSKSLDLGPATTRTPILFVRFSKVTDLSFGIHFFIQS